MNETIILVSADDRFTALIANSTDSQVILAQDANYQEISSYQRGIAILDLTTIEPTDELLKRLQKDSQYLVIVLDAENQQLVEEYEELMDDVWVKPLHPLVLGKRITAYQDMLAKVSRAMEFSTFAAFELRNPLASIRGYAKVLLEGFGGELNEKQSNFIAIIHSNSHRMNRIINNIRDLTAIQAKELELPR